MKVTIIGTRGFPEVQGGVEKHCEEICPRLVRHGIDITVITRTPYLKKPYRKNWKGVKFTNLWCPKTKSLEAISHTFLGVIIASRNHPDILHFHSIGPSLLIPFAKMMGFKVVMTHHGPDYKRAKWGWLAKKVLRLGEKVGCKHADEIIAITSDIKRTIGIKYLREAHLIPNGLSLPPRGENRGHNHISGLGLEPGKYILTVARLVPEKGLHDLVSAFSRLDTGWKLVIAGSADHETRYSKRLKAMAQKAKGVVMTGFVTGKTLEELYSNAGLFVLPSYLEGLPIALLEALSYGLSALVSDIPPHKELELGKNRYFTPGDVEELAEKLEYWMNRGKRHPKEQKKQLTNIQKRFNWDKVAARTYKIYTRISPRTP